MDYSGLIQAPISAAERKQLQHDLANLRATASRKGSTLDADEEYDQTLAGQAHFELGCWLYFYRNRVGWSDGLAARIDCARRIFEAGITNPRYRFFTAFEFGERQFDSIFEMGDSDKVIKGLQQRLEQDTTGNLTAVFKAFGWSMPH